MGTFRLLSLPTIKTGSTKIQRNLENNGIHFVAPKVWRRCIELTMSAQLHSDEGTPATLSPSTSTSNTTSTNPTSIDSTDTNLTSTEFKRTDSSNSGSESGVTEAVHGSFQPQALARMSDAEIATLLAKGEISSHTLEEELNDFSRSIKIRRMAVFNKSASAVCANWTDKSQLPYKVYQWEEVYKKCCENVIGYMPIPVGVAGPIKVDGQEYYVPMATTEGALVASTSRGCKAVNASGGTMTTLVGDGMTRGPCVSFPSMKRASEAKMWLDSEEGDLVMRESFNSTSRYAKLVGTTSALAGNNLYIRFKATTGDAMGMNMMSKGVEKALQAMGSVEHFTDMQVVSLSGNYCTDKKPAAVNWINGRGKSVGAEAFIPPRVVRDMFKTNVDTLVQLNISKNLIGSAMAGSVGGFNAHAANLVSAVFLATGQDLAQIGESSNCITIMRNVNGFLHVSVFLPSLEVGTVGGGTKLAPQAAMLDLLGVRGSNALNPGVHAEKLARLIAAATLACELSLCGALAAGQLVQAHMNHNRSSQEE